MESKLSQQRDAPGDISFVRAGLRAHYNVRWLLDQPRAAHLLAEEQGIKKSFMKALVRFLRELEETLGAPAGEVRIYPRGAMP